MKTKSHVLLNTSTDSYSIKISKYSISLILQGYQGVTIHSILYYIFTTHLSLYCCCCCCCYCRGGDGRHHHQHHYYNNRLSCTHFTANGKPKPFNIYSRGDWEVVLFASLFNSTCFFIPSPIVFHQLCNGLLIWILTVEFKQSIQYNYQTVQTIQWHCTTGCLIESETINIKLNSQSSVNLVEVMSQYTVKLCY